MRTGRRHELSAFTGDLIDQPAVCAIARLNRPHGRLRIVETQIFHLYIRPVTGVAALLQEWLDIARTVGGCSLGRSRGQQDTAARQEKQPHKRTITLPSRNTLARS